jgi:hypothetical protein
MVGLVFGGLESLCLVVDGQKMVRLVVTGRLSNPASLLLLLAGKRWWWVSWFGGWRASVP